MSARSYFASFFTRQYWRTLGSFFTAAFFAKQQLREDFWNRVEQEAEDRGTKD